MLSCATRNYNQFHDSAPEAGSSNTERKLGLDR